ncbi:simple sugar transport system permease protein [Pseudooceanicola antarcticus]|uniref:ABC transporter permease n=1 Tax=Pseudooceanicola antarcticus TaxID=1247613 RepID=A0A285JH66_9RHOB|nr:ABC transporter permease [Pseudooceanicola antarcticus]PJE31114.1 ABC transporter permease [Pseudooceanicola antarcticus]SNY58481.1 simple sugar transport system permease protein [Pseudooceanicola antarcticus]
MIDLFIAILRSGTPLVYVTLAGVIAQRSGIWHLGLEGIMIIGACATILGIVSTGSFALAMLIAILLCVAASVLLWVIIEKLRANPIIAGLGMTGLGLGGTALAVEAIFGSQATVSAPFGVPRLGEAFGRFGVLSIFVAALPLVIAAMWLLLRRTRFGLRLSASGEHPFALRSVGGNPSAIRLVALMISGILCAIGGAELAGGTLQFFAQGMTAGRGFMAFAAVVFGASHPLAAPAAAFLFAVLGTLGIRAQLVLGDRVPHDLLQMVPYLATVMAIWVSSRLRGPQLSGGNSELRDR